MVKHELNDPDFDAPSAMPEKSFSFEQFSPKVIFALGALGAFLVVCTIGFFILLSITLKGGLNIAKNSGITPTPIPNQPTPAAPQRPVAQAPSGTVPPVTDADHVRGNKKAELTWIEYSDFECPFCKHFHPSMLQMMKEYGSEIKWVYRHYPLSFHQNAAKEAEATECAAELGGNDAFWKYADAIIERTTSNGTGFALDALTPLAKELGLNESKFKSCLDSGKYAQRVQQDEAGGQQAGVNGTPGSFLIGKDGKTQFISGAVPYEQIKAAIDAQLQS